MTWNQHRNCLMPESAKYDRNQFSHESDVFRSVIGFQLKFIHCETNETQQKKTFSFIGSIELERPWTCDILSNFKHNKQFHIESVGHVLSTAHPNCTFKHLIEPVPCSMNHKQLLFLKIHHFFLPVFLFVCVSWTRIKFSLNHSNDFFCGLKCLF